MDTLQDQSTTRMHTAQCNYITTTRTQQYTTWTTQQAKVCKHPLVGVSGTLPFEKNGVIFSKNNTTQIRIVTNEH